jgi:hypothetical protein
LKSPSFGAICAPRFIGREEMSALNLKTAMVVAAAEAGVDALSRPEF